MHIFQKAAKILRSQNSHGKTAAILLAAGNSTRMGNGTNKQLLEINGIPVLVHSLLAYQKCEHIDEIVVVARPSEFDWILAMRKKHNLTKIVKIVAGGESRQESAKIGVSAISEGIEYVAIADGARCLITPEQISKVCLRAYEFRAASAAHLVSDTVKRATPMGVIKETVDREGLWLVQTPQVFHAALYTAALLRAEDDKLTVTDDNSLVEHLGYQVKLVECGAENLKITTTEDYRMAKAILAYRENNE